jgi:hypothetical protein
MAGCLKCGKEVQGKAAFCDECLAVMNQYPVKPGTVAHLLPRPKPVEYKPQESYREAAYKQQLQTLQRTNRWLVVLTVILSVLLLTMAGLLLHATQDTPEAPPIGKNYTTTTTTQQP